MGDVLKTTYGCIVSSGGRDILRKHNIDYDAFNPPVFYRDSAPSLEYKYFVRGGLPREVEEELREKGVEFNCGEARLIRSSHTDKYGHFHGYFTYYEI